MEIEFIGFTFSLINKTNENITFKSFDSEDKYKKDYNVNIKEIKPDDEFIIKFKVRIGKEIEGEIFFDKTSFSIENYIQSNLEKSEFKLYEYEKKYYTTVNYIMKYQPMSSLLQVSKISFNLFKR